MSTMATVSLREFHELSKKKRPSKAAVLVLTYMKCESTDSEI